MAINSPTYRVGLFIVIDKNAHTVYNIFMKNKLIGERPPLPMATRKQINDILEYLNQDALIEFIPHNIVVLAVDRAWCKLFPAKVSPVKRKKYEKFPF